MKFLISIAVSVLLAVAEVLGVTTAASAVTGCPASCTVYEFTGQGAVGGPHTASMNLALAAPNGAAPGARAELRDLNTAHADEQFAARTVPGGTEYVLNDGYLCLTGWAHNVVLQTCTTGGERAQVWTITTAGAFKNGRGRYLDFASPGPYAKAGTSLTTAADFTAHPAT